MNEMTQPSRHMIRIPSLAVWYEAEDASIQMSAQCETTFFDGYAEMHNAMYNAFLAIVMVSNGNYILHLTSRYRWYLKCILQINSESQIIYS